MVTFRGHSEMNYELGACKMQTLLFSHVEIKVLFLPCLFY